MYQYQPQQMGPYTQGMPQVYPYQPMQQTMQPQPADQPLVCRMVTGPEEARGVPVDFSGRPMTFLDLPHGRIYVKAFDAGNGSAVFREFRIYEDPQPETQAPAAVAYAPQEMVVALRTTVEQLEANVSRLEEELKNVKASRRRVVEVTADEN